MNQHRFAITQQLNIPEQLNRISVRQKTEANDHVPAICPTFCMMALFAPGFLLPFDFEQLRGFSTIQTDLLLTPLPLTFAFAAPFSGTLADRLGSRWLSPIGLAIACFGLFLLSQVNEQSTLWDILWRLALTGIGQGIFQSPNTRTMMGAAPLHAQGEASGLLATGRVIGQSLSVALN